MAACPRRMATRQRPRARRVPAGEPLLRGAAPCACRARRCASPGRLRRSWSRSPDFCRAFWGFGGATEKSARPWRMRARGAAPCRFCALLQQLRAALRGRENPSKIGRLAHYNFAQCGIRGRWHAWALHACMCARALEMPFSSTGSRASGIVRQKLVRLLLEEQDKVLRSYFAQKGGTRGQRGEGTHGKGREHVKWDMYV